MNVSLPGPEHVGSAYVDESESDQAADPGTYLLAAAILPPVRLAEARRSLRPLLVPGQAKHLVNAPSVPTGPGPITNRLGEPSPG